MKFSMYSKNVLVSPEVRKNLPYFTHLYEYAYRISIGLFIQRACVE